VLTAKVDNMLDADLALMLVKDRVKFKNKLLNSLSKPVILKYINNLNNTILPSLGKCVEYFQDKGLSSSQITLVKYILSGKAYNGYICKFA
jgi:hypothetical protein